MRSFFLQDLIVLVRLVVDLLTGIQDGVNNLKVHILFMDDRRQEVLNELAQCLKALDADYAHWGADHL